MAGEGKTIDYKVIFKTQTKELKEGLASITKSQAAAQKNAKAFTSHQQQASKQAEKLTKTEKQRQAAERKHVLGMSKEESKRHNAQVGYIQKQSKLLQAAQKQNAQLQQRLARAAGGGGPPPGPGGGAGANPRGPGGGGGRGFGRTVSTAVGTFLGNAALGGWNFLVGAAQSGYQQYMQYGQTLSKSIGLAPGKQISRGLGGAMGARLGYSRTDSAAMLPVMARATGEIGPREMEQGTRASGMEAGEVGDIFSTLRRAGLSFQGAGKNSASAGGEQFKRLMAGGLYSGLEKARLPEYFQGVQKLAEEQRNTLTGVVNVDAIGKQLSMLGHTGLPGMQGAAGANVLSKLNNAMTSPNGDAADALVMRAMGFGKPGGTTSYYDALKQRQKGVNDPRNLQALTGQVQSEYGKGREGNLALSNIAGISLEQSEAVMQIANSGKSQDEQLKEIGKVMDAGKSLEAQSLEAMKGLGGAVERIATLTNRGIKMGEKVAPLIEKVEDWEYQALQALLQLAGDVREITGYLKDRFGNKDKEASDAIANMQQHEREPISSDPVKRRKQMADWRRQEQRAEVALGEHDSLTGKIVDFGKDIWNGDDLGTEGAKYINNKMQILQSEALRNNLSKSGNSGQFVIPPAAMDALQQPAPGDMKGGKAPTDSGTVTAPSTPAPAAGGKPAASDPTSQNESAGGGTHIAFMMPDARISVPRVSMTPQGAGFHINKPSQGVA